MSVKRSRSEEGRDETPGEATIDPVFCIWSVSQDRAGPRRPALVHHHLRKSIQGCESEEFDIPDQSFRALRCAGALNIIKHSFADQLLLPR